MATKILDNLEIRKELDQLIGEVYAKNLFSGFGLFKDSLMFGLYQNGVFYLKASGSVAKKLEELGAVSYISLAHNSKSIISSYYRIPKDIIENKDLYKELILSSIQQIKDQKALEALLKKDRIKELVNLSIKHERLLAKVDIHTVEQFRKIGAIETYILLRKKGIAVTGKFYLSLVGALKNKHINLLTPEEKKSAIDELNAALRREGLKTIKFIDD